MGLGGWCGRVVCGDQRLVPGAALLAATGAVALNYVRQMSKAKQQQAVVEQLSSELTTVNEVLCKKQSKVWQLEKRLCKLANMGVNNKVKGRMELRNIKSKLRVERRKLRAAEHRGEVLAADLHHTERQLKVAKACLSHLLEQMEQEQKQAKQQLKSLLASEQKLMQVEEATLQLTSDLQAANSQIDQQKEAARLADQTSIQLRQELSDRSGQLAQIMAASTETASQLQESQHQLQVEKSAAEAERLQADHLQQELTAALQTSQNWKQALDAAKAELQQCAASLEVCRGDNAVLKAQLEESYQVNESLRRPLDVDATVQQARSEVMSVNEEVTKDVLPAPAIATNCITQQEVVSGNEDLAKNVVPASSITTACNTPRRAASGALPNSRRRITNNSSSSSSDDGISNGAPCCIPTFSRKGEIEGKRNSTKSTISTGSAAPAPAAKPPVGSRLPVPMPNMAAFTQAQDAALDVTSVEPAALITSCTNNNSSICRRRRSTRDRTSTTPAPTATAPPSVECQEVGSHSTQYAASHTDKVVWDYATIVQELRSLDGVSFCGPSEASLAAAAKPGTGFSRRPAGVPRLNMRPAENLVLLREELQENGQYGALAGLLRAAGCHSARWSTVKNAVDRVEAAFEHHCSAWKQVAAIDEVVMQLRQAKQQGAGAASAVSPRSAGYSRLLARQCQHPAQLLAQNGINYCLAAAVYGLGGQHLHPNALQDVTGQLRRACDSSNNASDLLAAITKIANAM